MTCNFSRTSKDKEGNRSGWRVNPSVILLPDQAASKHTAKVLVKRAKEICLIQNGRLLNRATRLNRFFLPPFPPPPPGCSVGFPSVPLERRRQRAAYKRQGCRETLPYLCALLPVPFTQAAARAARLRASICVLFYLAMPFVLPLQPAAEALRRGRGHHVTNMNSRIDKEVKLGMDQNTNRLFDSTESASGNRGKE